jgi:chemotaxis signal transduction protein
MKDDRRLADLRDTFDASFAQPAMASAGTDEVRMLFIAVGLEPWALALHELAGVARCPTVVPVPDTASHALGLITLRGRITPVFDLASLLGLARRGAPAFVALAASRAGAPVGVALAFDELVSQQAVSRAAITEAPGRTHRSGVIQQQAQLRNVIDLNSVMSSILGAPWQ